MILGIYLDNAINRIYGEIGQIHIRIHYLNECLKVSISILQSEYHAELHVYIRFIRIFS